MFSLTLKQIRLLRNLVSANGSEVTELAKSMNTNPTYMSRVNRDLVSKGFLEVDKEGNTKKVYLANTQHAILLRRFILNNPNFNLNIFTGKAISILVSISCMNLKTWDEIIQNSNVSYLTVQRHLSNFKKVGLVRKNESYGISPRFQTIKEFLKTFQDYIHMVEATKYAKDAVVKWGCGECFLVETEKNLDLPVTGVTAFPRYGAQFIIDKNLYIKCNNEKLSLEDHIINHLLAYSSYILLFLSRWSPCRLQLSL
jgi:hypothetical protein